MSLAASVQVTFGSSSQTLREILTGAGVTLPSAVWSIQMLPPPGNATPIYLNAGAASPSTGYITSTGTFTTQDLDVVQIYAPNVTVSFLITKDDIETARRTSFGI